MFLRGRARTPPTKFPCRRSEICHAGFLRKSGFFSCFGSSQRTKGMDLSQLPARPSLLAGESFRKSRAAHVKACTGFNPQRADVCPFEDQGKPRNLPPKTKCSCYPKETSCFGSHGRFVRLHRTPAGHIAFCHQRTWLELHLCSLYLDPAHFSRYSQKWKKEARAEAFANQARQRWWGESVD